MHLAKVPRGVKLAIRIRHAKLADPDIRSRVPRRCSLASWSGIGEVISAAQRGVIFDHQISGKPELVGVLRTSGSHYDDLLATGTAALYIPPALLEPEECVVEWIDPDAKPLTPFQEQAISTFERFVQRPTVTTGDELERRLNAFLETWGVQRAAMRAVTVPTEEPPVWPVVLMAPHEMDPREIEQTIAAHSGFTVDELHARLRPGALSASGFLGPQESLGEVIRRDAQYLHEHGQTPAAVGAELHWTLEVASIQYALRTLDALSPDASDQDRRIAGAMGLDLIRCTRQLRARKPQFDPFVQQALACVLERKAMYMGHQDDPFSRTDQYGRIGLGGREYFVRVDGSSRTISDLLPYLVHAYCFFEGTVPHRLDPALALTLIGR